MITRTKRIYNSFHWSLWKVLKGIENVFSVFVLSYTNSRKGLRELEEKLREETLACRFAVFPQ